jgi:hypothetical protein
MKASRMALQVPKVAPTRAPDGKWKQGKGERLLEAHRAHKAVQDAKPAKG